MTAAAARPDPLNPKRYRIDPESVDAPEYRGNSVLEMPDAPPQPWIAQRPGVPAGQVEKHRYKSAALNNEREIAIYLPPQYSPHAEPYPLLVLFDEEAYLSLVPTPTILDNLISEGRIPPVIALLVGNAKDDARDRELLCNPGFTGVLVTEVLPWAHGLYNFTRDPRQTVVAGVELGRNRRRLRWSVASGDVWKRPLAVRRFPPRAAIGAAMPGNPARNPTGSCASSSPAPGSRCAFTWTLGARNSMLLAGVTPFCFALARCATCCAPRATRCTSRSLLADTTT